MQNRSGACRKNNRNVFSAYQQVTYIGNSHCGRGEAKRGSDLYAHHDMNLIKFIVILLFAHLCIYTWVNGEQWKESGRQAGRQADAKNKASVMQNEEKESERDIHNKM
jgi:hypothetical protein